jgi:spore coat protein CotF
MTQTGTQKTKIKCSQCGKTFDSVQELHDHEKTCEHKAGIANSAVNNENLKKPETATPQEVEEDMEVEDRFEASDN